MGASPVTLSPVSGFGFETEMDSTALFYARWCFYCKTGFESQSELRAHVGETHPESAREKRYRDAEQDATAVT